MNWHIRYSPRTTPLFSGLKDPIQHAVDNDTIKTLCGRNAQEFWKMDNEYNNNVRHVTCERCKPKCTPKSGEAV